MYSTHLTRIVDFVPSQILVSRFASGYSYGENAELVMQKGDESSIGSGAQVGY
jgi:hypothetical protein